MIASQSSCAPSTQTDRRFLELAEAARSCRACPTMAGCPRVLSTANGPVPCAVMLVGEAPGRLGAARTGVPFSGDESGRRLDMLLAAAGWARAEVFITNAVLCVPTDGRGRNRSPARAEVRRCAHWLEQQLELVDPTLIVALGAVALRSLELLHPHGLRVRDASCPPIRWGERWLAAAYHPSARAAIHCPLEQQVADFAQLGRWLTDLNGETGASR